MVAPWRRRPRALEIQTIASFRHRRHSEYPRIYRGGRDHTISPHQRRVGRTGSVIAANGGLLR